MKIKAKEATRNTYNPLNFKSKKGMKAIHEFSVKGMPKLLLLFSLSVVGLITPSCGQDTKKEAQGVAREASLKKVTVPVEGMSCSSCVSTVNKTVKAFNGVKNVEVSLEKREATITFTDEKISTGQISKAISDKGYKTGKAAEVKSL